MKGRPFSYGRAVLYSEGFLQNDVGGDLHYFARHLSWRRHDLHFVAVSASPIASEMHYIAFTAKKTLK